VSRDAVVQARGITVRFDGVVANDGVDLDVGAGAIVGLIGPNGAGKTTFIDALSGFVPASGTLMLGDRWIERLAPHARARAGLARTWQSLELFPDLTVAENLQIAARRFSLRGALADLVRPSRRAEEAAVARALELVGIAALADRRPGELSLGHEKLVGVARALAAAPRALLLDEPAAGLPRSETDQLGRHLRAVADSGVAVLLVDHDMGLVLDVCDDLYVLDFGRVIAHGRPAEVRRDPAVVAAYLGGEHARAAEAAR